MNSPPISTSLAGKPRGRGWLVYLAVLLVLSIISFGVMYWFNAAQQLKPQQLADARARWAEKAPKNYDLEYTVSGSTSNAYLVRVRNGEVTSVSCNGAELPPSQHIHHTMNAIFYQIEDFLELDTKPNRPATFTIGIFDKENGHVRRFIRRVQGSQERIEIQAKLIPRGDSAFIPTGFMFTVCANSPRGA